MLLALGCGPFVSSPLATLALSSLCFATIATLAVSLRSLDTVLAVQASEGP